MGASVAFSLRPGSWDFGANAVVAGLLLLTSLGLGCWFAKVWSDTQRKNKGRRYDLLAKNVYRRASKNSLTR